MKDFAAYQGNYEMYGSRDASREAFKQGLIKDGHIWMEMIKSRNKSSHTYNENTSEEIVADVVNHYINAFMEFKENLGTVLIIINYCTVGMPESQLNQALERIGMANILKNRK